MRLPDSPYRGLSAFGESELDALFFFGRERETELVAANLVASRLTIFYGASGVGKTSVLRAGVARTLRALPEQPAVVVFDSWKADANQELASAIAREAGIEPLATAVETAQAAAKERDLYLVLDQIEELFLYEDRQDERSVSAQLPELILEPGLRTHVALGVRDDALAQLDVLKTRIPGLLGNRLRLDHLDRDEARAAIRGPISRWNELDGTSWQLEDALVENVLDEVTAGRVAVGGAGRGMARADGDGRVESPYLQLVMERLWQVEAAEQSGTIRAATLARLGGAARIVRDHLDRALETLSDSQKESAARMFDHLVTPSGTKISHRVSDLAQFAGRTPEELQPVLARLTGLRILRAGGPEDGAERRYEIYHDVLADAVLEWRTRWDAQRIAEAARLEAERRRHRALVVAGIAIAALAVMTVVAIFALQQRHQAIEQRRAARAQEVAARSAARLAKTRELLAKALLRLDTAPQSSLALALRAARLEQTDEVGEVLRSALVDAPLRLVLRAKGGAHASAAFSPGGRLVLTGGEDGNARLFDAQSGRLVHVLPHHGPITSARFIGPGRLVATASADGTAAIWVTSTGHRLHVLPHGAPVSDVSVTRSGDRIATVGGRVVRIWSTRTGRLVRRIRVAADASSAAFSPDGRSIVVTGDDRFARVYGVPSGRFLFEVPHGGRVTSASFSPAGDVLATTSADGTAGLWNARTGRLRHLLTGHRGPVLGAAFAGGGNLLVTAGADNEARVWNVALGTRKAVLFGHTGAVTEAAFSTDAADIVTASSDHDARVWETAGGRPRKILRGHTGPVVDASFDRTGAMVVTASRDGTARVWDPGTGDSLQLVARRGGPILDGDAAGSLVATAGGGHGTQVWRIGRRGPLLSLRQPSVDAVAVARSGSLLATAGAGGDVRVWRMPSGTLVARLPRGGGTVTRVAFSRGGGRLVTAGSDGAVKIWNPTGGGPIAVLHPGRPITGADLSPDGTRVVISGRGEARIWDVASRRPLRALGGGGSGIKNAVFSPDGKMVLTSGPNRDARLWDTRTGRPVRSVRETLGARGRASFSPDGRWIVTAGPAHAGVWDASTGRNLVFLRGHNGRLTMAVFATDRRIVTAAVDGTVRTYRCLVCGSTAQLIAVAKAREARIKGG